MLTIALMSVEQSEKIVVERMSDWIILSIPLRIAIASAMSGEETESTVWDPDRFVGDRSLYMHQAIPARFEETSQAASTKHVISQFEVGL